MWVRQPTTHLVIIRLSYILIYCRIYVKFNYHINFSDICFFYYKTMSGTRFSYRVPLIKKSGFEKSNTVIFYLHYVNGCIKNISIHRCCGIGNIIPESA